MTKTYTEKLQDLAKYMENNLRAEGFDLHYKVKEVYIDFGQGIKKETIVVYEKGEDLFQILSNKQMREIEEGTFEDEYSLYKEHVSMFNKRKLSNPF